MSNVQKRPLAEVEPVAEVIKSKLEPYCYRIVIAGSIRRRRPTVGDIEIVALPKVVEEQLDLFGYETKKVNLLEDFFDEAFSSHQQLLLKDGPRQKQFRYGRFKVDLYLPASPERWGWLLTARTGGKQFNKWLINYARYEMDCVFKDGRLLKHGKQLETPEEEDVFNVLELPFIPFEDRDGERWTKYYGMFDDSLV